MLTQDDQAVIRHVGEALRRHRKRAGLTLEDLSRLSGVGLATLSHAENGNRDAKLSTLVRLARALRVEMADLFRQDLPGQSGSVSHPATGYDLDE